MEIGHFDLVAAAETPQLMPLSSPDGKPVMVKDAEGTPKHFELPVLSFDNEKVVQAGREFDRENAKEKPQHHEADWNRMRRGAVAAAAVTDWRDLTINGKKLDHSNAPGILGSRRFSWIADQVFMFGGYRGNFFKAMQTG